MTTRPTVLCVDDDPNILNGLALALRGRYQVETAEGGEEALACLESGKHVDVILCDLSMPGMNGPQFLARSRELAPDATRLMLTGQASVGGAVAAINNGQIFRLLQKPCPPDELLCAIDDAVGQQRRNQLLREKLRERGDDAFRRLADAERRAALGDLASGVGAELASVAAAFDVALDLATEASRRGLPTGPEELAILYRVRDHVARHARSLRDLGAPAPELPESCDVAEAAEGAISMLRFAGLLRHVKVQLALPDGAAPVPLPRVRLEQVLLSLVQNAVEAIDEVPGRRGRVFVSVARDDDGRGVTCSVEDNGAGVAPAVHAGLFEPHVTSKQRRGAAGMGLFLVRAIVEGVGGRVEYETREGRGATFTVKLPRSSAGAALPPA